MPTIVPGYDFDTDETPSYGKFIAQAQGLHITGMEFSDLENDFQFIFNAQASDGSGATQINSVEGGMWFDPSGEMWVTVRVYGWWGSSGYSGPEYVKCPLFKPRRGGFDTIRGCRGDDTANFRRAPVQGAGIAANGYSPTSIQRTTNFINENSVGAKEVGFVNDTPVSGVYFPVTVRGGYHHFATNSLLTTTDLPYRFTVVTSTGYQERSVSSAGSSPAPFALGEIYGAGPNKTDAGSVTEETIAWAYGRVVANQ